MTESLLVNEDSTESAVLADVEEILLHALFDEIVAELIAPPRTTTGWRRRFDHDRGVSRDGEGRVGATGPFIRAHSSASERSPPATT